MSETRDGGYDDGYQSCPCFWGSEPGSLVRRLAESVSSMQGLRVLDAGCGEGKNSAFLAGLGAVVVAMDVSESALSNARKNFGDPEGVSWNRADVCSEAIPANSYDVVVAYGLLHCLGSYEEIEELVVKFMTVTRPGGLNVICAFNDRAQDLVAHPGFSPCLVDHDSYVSLYRDWTVVEATDSDLYETHPHNKIPHSHSLTRMICRRPS